MLFSPRVELIAMERQSWMDGYGSWCAMCGAGLWDFTEQSFPRVPISKGGNKKADNCVIVCRKCFSKLVNPGKEIIPWEAIAYYNTAPPDWRERRKPPL
jgi:hypothetical protein